MLSKILTEWVGVTPLKRSILPCIEIQTHHKYFELLEGFQIILILLQDVQMTGKDNSFLGELICFLTSALKRKEDTRCDNRRSGPCEFATPIAKTPNGKTTSHHVPHHE